MVATKKIDQDLENSLSMLDRAIGESPSNFTSDVEAWTTPLSSGWDDLDSAIKWHLRNVSLLLQKLASCERTYTDNPDFEGPNNRNLLCVREDLLAMAVDSQVCLAQILNDHYLFR